MDVVSAASDLRKLLVTHDNSYSQQSALGKPRLQKRFICIKVPLARLLGGNYIDIRRIYRNMIK